MGLKNSSKTRVAPVLSQLRARDPSGRSWLHRLIRLGSRSSSLNVVDVGELPGDHPNWWGEDERRLQPPLTLLRWLVGHTPEPSRPGAWGSPPVRKKRLRLVQRDASTIAEALGNLEGQPRQKAWYVLEGPSSPDACLQTDRILLVIEGKRTERNATTKTTWMPIRSQMIRHMDAAWEVKSTRMVLGLMIVEGVDVDAAVTPHWQAEAKAQVSTEMLDKSLPHRTEGERRALAAGFLGVTTWQRVCREFGLAWPPDAELGQ